MIRLIGAFLLSLCCASSSWALSFVATAHIDNISSAGVTIAVPTGTANNDIMFALIKRTTNTAPSAPASGWSGPYTATATNAFWLYYRVASSEPADYTWTWAGAERNGGTIVTFRDGFNTSTPIDVVSNTGYVTSDTTARAASMTVSAANSVVLYFGYVHSSAAVTFTAPASPGTFTEHVDYHDGGGRFARTVGSQVWSGSGATGDMDITLSATVTDKHAFAVALQPAAAGAETFGFRRRLQVQP